MYMGKHNLLLLKNYADPPANIPVFNESRLLSRVFF